MSARDFPLIDVPIVIASWEIECCGPLPAVGQPTSWRLIFMPVHTPDMKSLERDPGSVTELEWQVELLPGGAYGRALYRNDFAAYFYHSDWGAGGRSRPLPALGRQTLHGLIDGTRHGGAEYDSFGSMTATVSRIQVISWEHRLVERSQVRVPSSAELRDVRQSPKWFRRSPHPRRSPGVDSDNSSTGISDRSKKDADPFREETGLLVTLRDDADRPGSGCRQQP